MASLQPRLVLKSRVFFRIHKGHVSIARFLNKCFTFLWYNIAENSKKEFCSLDLAHLWDIQ